MVRKFPIRNNPRRHVFVHARVIVIVNSGHKKADGVKNGVNQRVVIQKVIAVLSKSGLCSYTAVADE